MLTLTYGVLAVLWPCLRKSSRVRNSLGTGVQVVHCGENVASAFEDHAALPQ